MVPKGAQIGHTDRLVVGKWVEGRRFLRKIGDPMKYLEKTSLT